MSWENLADAYRTRLGNLTAKSVLVLIVDEANAEGLAFAGLTRISTLTEINKRTTLRIVQVFGEIDLVERTEALLKGKRRPALQVNLARLGLDLAAEFGSAYKAASGKCLRDVGDGVSETHRSVSETHRSVSETLPPNPHSGSPLLFPLQSPTPVAPASGGAAPIERAVDQVCSALGISNRRKRKPIRHAIELATEKGEPAPTVALAMIAAVREQGAEHSAGNVKFQFGMQKFFGDGIWRDKNRWAWDVAGMRLRAIASMGSR